MAAGQTCVGFPRVPERGLLVEGLQWVRHMVGVCQAGGRAEASSRVKGGEGEGAGAFLWCTLNGWAL